MYKDNILKRYPRYDMDFTYRDPAVNLDQSEDSSTWVYSALVLLWVVGVAALILYVCAQSPRCMCYNWLCMLRCRPYCPQTGAEYSEDWASPHAVSGEEIAHQALIPSSPSSVQPGAKRFDDLPPAYSEVMKSGPPSYPGQISVVIPDREWTSRTLTDNRDNTI